MLDGPAFNVESSFAVPSACAQLEDSILEPANIEAVFASQ